jgi:tRNA A-37 threonylcarbamoyl transferase component Bud32
MARTRSANEDTVMSSADPLADGYEVVVKFTAQYHAEAHRRLAAKGFAPVLHACVPVCGGLFMVVMDRVHGELAWDLVRRRPIPHDVYKDIHDAIMMLHSDNLVFGDLRTPNIMVVPDGSGLDTPCRGVLLDFDWVGTHGIGRYPDSLDDGLVDWASGIKRYAIMDKAHDIAMLKKFEDQCRSV